MNLVHADLSVSKLRRRRHAAGVKAFEESYKKAADSRHLDLDLINKGGKVTSDWLARVEQDGRRSLKGASLRLVNLSRWARRADGK